MASSNDFSDIEDLCFLTCSLIKNERVKKTGVSFQTLFVHSRSSKVVMRGALLFECTLISYPPSYKASRSNRLHPLNQSEGQENQSTAT